MTEVGPINHPSSLVLWGPDRATLDRVALAIARGIGPEFYWFDIVAEDGSLSAEERRVLDEVPPQRAYRVSPPEMELQNAVGNLALWAVIKRSEAEAQQSSELADFLRIPDAIQRAVSQHPTESGPATVVVTNADHASHLYPGDVGTFLPYIRLLNRRAITLVLTNGGMPRANTTDFEVILKLQRGVSGSWSMMCEKGPQEAEFSPFRAGSETPVDSLVRSLESTKGEG